MDLKEQHERAAFIDALRLSEGWRKTFKENRRFNIWGLIFGWLYVGWLGMGGTATFYFLMMLVPMTVFGAVLLDTRVGVCLGIAVMHVWIAFRVNQKYWKYVLKNRAEFEVRPDTPEQPDTPVMYFDISKKRMFLCSVLTLGVYNLYWMYQNWEALKTAKKDRSIGPLCHTVFWMFYLYSLFKKIFKDAEKVGFKTSPHSAEILFSVYLLMCVVSQSNVFPAVIFWIMIFISPFVFFPVMDAIRANNKALDETAAPRRGVTSGEVIILFFFGLIEALIVYGYFSVKDPNKMLTAFLEKGVPDYCLQNGYRMEIWPAVADNVLKPTYRQNVFSPKEELLYKEKGRGFVDAVYQNLKQTEPLISMQETCLLLDQNANQIIMGVVSEFQRTVDKESRTVIQVGPFYLSFNKSPS